MRPEGGPGRRRMEEEQIQLAAESAVVTLLRLLQAMQVLLEVLLREERRPVDAVKGLPLRVTAPIGSGRIKQLEVLQPPCRGDVRPPT
jgi:hypothetical protein